MTPKIYVVQAQDGRVLGVKLSFEAAQSLAKAEAPARVLIGWADKTPEPNVTAYISDRRPCN